ncbi:hypothetical protein AWH48_08480 [Domibacillus aminovorans]|uniref:Uncharacterized protein n=1 Tax=Domibacillus aminovorans TaxID=29332 RepID=A0A177KNB2_9BACI|nr:hypothetical protein [Domibacillus aminovorans]OAH54617.1 hypothetical protein AWH48_08480 [Domibacillus aminovorans]
MIVYNEPEIKTFLIAHLSPFSAGSNFVIIIVDPYFGGHKSQLQLRVEVFLNFMFQVLNNPKIIWFCNEDKCTPIHTQDVLSIDLSRQGIAVHDRFLFIYDGNKEQIVSHIHLGGSINSFNIDGNQSLSIMRFSTLKQEEIKEIEHFIQQLERIYYLKTSSSNWGC